MKVRERKRAICATQTWAIRSWMVSDPFLSRVRTQNWAADMQRRENSRMLIESAPEEHIIERGTRVVGEEPMTWSEAIIEGFVVAGEALPGKTKSFVVARKKDGVIVGTFDTVEEAQAVIDKAKAGKKAALVLL